MLAGETPPFTEFLVFKITNKTSIDKVSNIKSKFTVDLKYMYIFAEFVSNFHFSLCCGILLFVYLYCNNV